MKKKVVIVFVLSMLLMAGGCVREASQSKDEFALEQSEPAAAQSQPSDKENADVGNAINQRIESIIADKEKDDIDQSEQKAVQKERKVTLVSDSDVRCTIELGMMLEEATDHFSAAAISFNGDITEERYHNQLFNSEYSIFFEPQTTEAGEIIWIINAISITTPIIETQDGLRVGDLEEKIEQVCGPSDELQSDDEGHRYYTYYYEGYYLTISAGNSMTDEQCVFNWALCLE